MLGQITALKENMVDHDVNRLVGCSPRLTQLPYYDMHSSEQGIETKYF